MGKKLIFLGAPGSGKGTHAQVLQKELDIAHISTGDRLRYEKSRGSSVGLEAKKYMDAGQLVPNEVVNEIAKIAILENVDKGFILDGYPRTVDQAKFLDSFVSIDKVVYLDVPLNVIIERLCGRRTCSNDSCKAIYHIKNKPPKTEGVCDACGAKLMQRSDDNEETIKNRFAVYEKETSPLIEYYKSKIVKIDGVGESSSVLKEILNRIG